MTTPPPIERVVLVHAMNSTLRDHWYPWLGARLADAGLPLVAPAMPNPWAPRAGDWYAVLQREVGSVDASTLVIAHSVGNAAALRFLSGLRGDWSLGGLVNVAGFAQPQPGNDLTIPFVRGIDLAAVRAHTTRLDAFVGSNDPEVPRALTDDLARHLGSDVHLIEGAGHFRDEDGYREFPALEALVRRAAGQIVATEPESTR